MTIPCFETRYLGLKLCPKSALHCATNFGGSVVTGLFSVKLHALIRRKVLDATSRIVRNQLQDS